MITQPVFVGFFPKKTYRNVASMAIPGIVEVCSISNCISDAPDDWISKWQHNDLGFFDTEEKAQGVLPAESSGYQMYAYEMFPYRCLAGKAERVSVNSVASEVPAGYDFLGYDIVTKSISDFFECSPLSCNGVANEFSVNTHCLIGNMGDAEEVFRQICEKSIGEPGPYYLFKIYRKHAF